MEQMPRQVISKKDVYPGGLSNGGRRGAELD